MSFIDELRQARESRISILHEFWAQYDPYQARVHAFFEAHDDSVFFGPQIERMLPKGARLISYSCNGKSRVVAAFEEITRRVPDAKLVLFFVDKDLEDVLGVPWPTDPRIFVTDVYSIENYGVTREVFLRFFRASVRLTDINFDEAPIADKFEAQLIKFHKRVMSMMAWIVVARRARRRPNVNNINVSEVLQFVDQELQPRIGIRHRYLERACGVTLPAGSLRLVLQAARELSQMPPKRVVRGKFEAWFFVEFWVRLIETLRQVAVEGGGKIAFRLNVTAATFVPVLASFVDTPRSLDLFLRAHLSPQTILSAVRRPEIESPPFWKRVIRRLRR
jgi:hypothetical protein